MELAQDVEVVLDRVAAFDGEHRREASRGARRRDVAARRAQREAVREARELAVHRVEHGPRAVGGAVAHVLRVHEAGEDLRVEHAAGAARQVEVAALRRGVEVVAAVGHLGQRVGVRVEDQRAAVQRGGGLGDSGESIHRVIMAGPRVRITGT